MTRGLILAGGRSQRFGAEKALARLDGLTLLERAWRRLSPDCQGVAVSAAPGSQTAALALELGLPVLTDPPGAPAGPLAGLLAGLEWGAATGGRFLVTLPCDAPLTPDDMVPRLLAAIGSGDAATARSARGLEPLCAVWRTTFAPRLAAILGEGRHPAVRDLLMAAGAVQVEVDAPDAFLNINTPQDLAEAERRLSGR